ncbi:MAG TPA: ribonuclease D [Thermoanaerobaculia bacterium]|nr:ribonuclease D [Thermoanaerobaculia bacterium]
MTVLAVALPSARLPVVRLETTGALAAAVAGWQRQPVIGLDTEFVRERTFFPRLGLIQIADDSAAYLIDPLAGIDLEPLAALLRAPAPLKVLHSASEDIEVLYRVLGALPAPLFDTQVAAGLAGAGAALGYQRLVAALLEVELGKGETRTNWLARPLSPAQLAYAAEDVSHLLPLYARLRRELELRGRLEWAREDSAALLDTARFDSEPETAYRRLRSGGRLKRRQLGVLRALAAWREREARRRDLPRSFVLRDDLLLSLAVRQPLTAQELERLPALDAQQAARDGAQWLEIVRRAVELPPEELPPERWRPPSAVAARQLEGLFRDAVRARAVALDLAPELLAPRRILDALLRSALTDPEPRLPPELCGWRRAVVGEELLRLAGSAT